MTAVAYATLVQRIKAALYDYLILFAYLVLIAVISMVFRPAMGRLFMSSAAAAETAGFLFLTLPVCLYFIISETSKRQGTWGKVKVGIRVSAHNSDKPVALWRAVLRNMVKFLPWEMAHYAIWRFRFPTGDPEWHLCVVLGLAYGLVLLYGLCPLANKKRKTVYDWIAGTSVTRM